MKTRACLRASPHCLGLQSPSRKAKKKVLIELRKIFIILTQCLIKLRLRRFVLH
jgi:hypothetical protein